MLEISSIFTRFAIDLFAVLVLMFAIYYPRYKHKEMAISATLFNIFAFSVLTILSSVQFSVAAGFGLFAILALFTLRSEQINKLDIAYFFGSVSFAVISSIEAVSLEIALPMIATMLIASYLVDHPKVLRSAQSMRATLDHIPDGLASDQEVLKQEFETRLGVEVLAVRIIDIDYIQECIKLEISYRQRG